MEVSSRLLAANKRNVSLFWYATSILSASPSHQISVHVWLQCGVHTAWPIEPVQGGDLEPNAASDGMPVHIRNEIDGVLRTCGYVADDSSNLVLDSLQLVERLPSGTIVAVRCNSQTNVNYISRHGVSNVTRYRAADVAQTPYVEVGCFRDVVDIIIESMWFQSSGTNSASAASSSTTIQPQQLATEQLKIKDELRFCRYTIW